MRQTVAVELEGRLVAELKPLAMEKVQFKVGIKPCSPTAAGADQITFLFSPNPGEPLQPLTEIASGGEMSRFLLALQASFSQIDSVGTLVFDEIDVGVSGRVTQAIAEKLFQLSQHHQVLCVTHQAIVAAMADQHFYVSKHIVGGEESNGKVKASRDRNGKDRKSKDELEAGTETADVRTVVRVAALSADQRREELAQLAGGQTAQEAIAFADSLLNQASLLRQSYAQSAVPPSNDEEAVAPSGKTKAAKVRTARKLT